MLVKLDEIKELRDALLYFRLCKSSLLAFYAKAEGHVLLDRHVRKQRKILKDHAHVAIGDRLIRNILPVPKNLSGRRHLQIRQSCVMSSSSRTRRDQKGDEFARPDRHVDAINRPGSVAVTLKELAKISKFNSCQSSRLKGPHFN